MAAVGCVALVFFAGLTLYFENELIQKNADFVGKNFAKEAKAIHEGKSKERAIYGQANRKDLEELKSKNIEVVNIPWVQDDN